MKDSERGPLAADQILARLPSTFRTAEALERVTKRQLETLRLDGYITPIARGLYRKSDWYGDKQLVEIASAARDATIALRSALVRHDLSDEIPTLIDIAIPRGDWAPTVVADVRWHRFATDTFDIGREHVDTDGDRTIGLYSAPRTIIDIYRIQHHEGVDQANDALKRWLRKGVQPSEILRMARSFPHAQRALQRALSILL